MTNAFSLGKYFRLLHGIYMSTGIFGAIDKNRSVLAQKRRVPFYTITPTSANRRHDSRRCAKTGSVPHLASAF